MEDSSDADSDLDSDGRDFLAWQRQFSGTANLAEVNSSALPEPTAARMLGCVIGLVLSFRLRRQ